MTNLTHTFSLYLFRASTSFEQQVLIIRRTNLCQYIIWYNTMWWVSVLYQMMYWNKLVFLMMSTCCSKHVQAWNKYIQKVCVKLVINQNYVEMHGQQNIKLWNYTSTDIRTYKPYFACCFARVSNLVPHITKIEVFFHIHTVHLDIIKVLFIHQLMHKWTVGAVLMSILM
jgi:hypothetical protein